MSVNGSGLFPRSFPFGMCGIGAGAVIPGPKGPGGGGGGGLGGPGGFGVFGELPSLSSSPSPGSSSPSPPGGPGKSWDGKIGSNGNVCFCFPLSFGR